MSYTVPLFELQSIVNELGVYEKIPAKAVYLDDPHPDEYYINATSMKFTLVNFTPKYMDWLELRLKMAKNLKDFRLTECVIPSLERIYNCLPETITLINICRCNAEDPKPSFPKGMKELRSFHTSVYPTDMNERRKATEEEFAQFLNTHLHLARCQGVSVNYGKLVKLAFYTHPRLKYTDWTGEGYNQVLIRSNEVNFIVGLHVSRVMVKAKINVLPLDLTRKLLKMLVQFK